LFGIKKNFVDEAISAPHLFSDLAKVELYIAESYRTRSIIEILQNADDADSTKFLIHQYDDKLIIANNGNPFSKEDIVALCRSGSSTKTRGVGKIGYRGIGFKSVVGICDNVKVLSGDLLFEFSKSLTKDNLNITTDVPLIRIPHILTNKYKDDLISALPSLSSYTTIFILSGINIRLVTEEIKQFNSSSILFLNRIEKLSFNINGISKKIQKSYSENSKVTINESENIESWYVVGTSDTSSKVAFKLEADNIVPASESESVIHAFLPTEENPGAYLKLNGNFSTEPSRKRVDLDKLSIESLNECCCLIANEINNTFCEKKLIGIFSVFKNSPNGRFKKLLKENLFNLLRKGINLGQKQVELSKLRLKPSWLNYNDYSISSFEIIPQDVDEIYDFFTWLGVDVLSVEEYLASYDFKKTSTLGYFELISHIAKKYRFILPDNILEQLNTKAIFPTVDGMRCSAAIQNANKELHEDYLMLLHSAENDSDIKILFKKIGFNNVLALPQQKGSGAMTATSMAEPHKEVPKNNFHPQVKKWRAAELNVKEWFSKLPEVLLAKDVSKSHVGYDVEVKLKDGSEYFVEVKKVVSFSEAFQITNNEYAVGSQLKNNYLIAIVAESSDEFLIKFIKNPINVLTFEKRITSIAWVCDTYDAQLTDL
jgi:hypothetical protein